MPSTINSTVPYSWPKRTGIPMLLTAIAVYLWCASSLHDPATAKPSVCTTTTTTTTTTPAR